MIMFSHFKIVFLCFVRNPFDDGLKVPICEIGLYNVKRLHMRSLYHPTIMSSIF